MIQLLKTYFYFKKFGFSRRLVAKIFWSFLPFYLGARYKIIQISFTNDHRHQHVNVSTNREFLTRNHYHQCHLIASTCSVILLHMKESQGLQKYKRFGINSQKNAYRFSKKTQMEDQSTQLEHWL